MIKNKSLNLLFIGSLIMLPYHQIRFIAPSIRFPINTSDKILKSFIFYKLIYFILYCVWGTLINLFKLIHNMILHVLNELNGLMGELFKRLELLLVIYNDCFLSYLPFAVIFELQHILFEFTYNKRLLKNNSWL